MTRIYDTVKLLKMLGVWTVSQLLNYGAARLSRAKGRHRRPGYDKLLKAITRREIDLVAAWYVKRLGRSLTDLLSFSG